MNSENKKVLPRKVQNVLEMMLDYKLAVAPLFKNFCVIPYDISMAYTEEQRKEKGIALLIKSEEFGQYLIVTKDSPLAYPREQKEKVMKAHLENRQAANWIPSLAPSRLI